MSPTVPQLLSGLLEALKSFGEPLLAALLVAFLAFRRTKSETKWRAKHDAYQRILSSVEDIRYWAEETYADALMLPSIGQQRLLAAADSYEEAKRVLWSHVYVGGLVVCEAARLRLDKMLSEIAGEEFEFQENPGDPDDFTRGLAAHCDKVRNIANEHIPHILELAKGDLK
jgi:hypothetical protein